MKTIVAISAITIIVITCLIMGVNGYLVGIGLSLIAGLAGYNVGKAKK